MDKLTKKILNEMHNNDPKKSVVCTYMNRFERDGAMTIDELAAKIGASIENTSLAADYLCKEGFAEYRYLGNHKAGFRLTHEGNNYRRFSLEASVKRMRDGIFLPLAVSVIANTISVLLQMLL